MALIGSMCPIATVLTLAVDVFLSILAQEWHLSLKEFMEPMLTDDRRRWEVKVASKKASCGSKARPLPTQ